MKSSFFQYSCLPSSVACASRLFTKVFNPVYSRIRSLGSTFMGHTDNSLLLGYNLNSVNMTIQLPSTKAEHVRVS